MCLSTSEGGERREALHSASSIRFSALFPSSRRYYPFLSEISLPVRSDESTRQKYKGARRGNFILGPCYASEDRRISPLLEQMVVQCGDWGMACVDGAWDESLGAWDGFVLFWWLVVLLSLGASWGGGGFLKRPVRSLRRECLTCRLERSGFLGISRSSGKEEPSQSSVVLELCSEVARTSDPSIPGTASSVLMENSGPSRSLWTCQQCLLLH